LSPPRRTRRIIGIDPGSRLCGWGLLDVEGASIAHVDNGVVAFRDRQPLHERLVGLYEALTEIVEDHLPTDAAAEGIFHARNPRSALILGHARGVALMCVARQGLAIHEYTPQQVKKAVSGSGRADKLQVQRMVQARLGLPEPPQEDAADAVAVAICHAQSLLFPGSVPAPTPRKRKGGARADWAALAERQKLEGKS
jgi:crossover junction endodeoxyribonuclease RuvC